MAMTFGPAQPLNVGVLLPPAQLQQHARFDAGSPDAVLIEPIARAACGWVERYSRFSLTSRQWRMRLDAFDSFIEFPVSPVTAITAIAYRDRDGADQTAAASIWRLDGQTLRPVAAWPGGAEGVTITFMAGFVDVLTEAPELHAAAVIMFTHLWDRRDGEAADALRVVPPAAKVLCDLYRTPVIAA